VHPKDEDELGERIAEGWDLLQDGDLDGATAVLATLLAAAPDEPEVITFSGVIAAATGEPERGLELLGRAAELDEEYASPLIHAAELHLYSLDDPAAALAACDRALERVEDDEDLADTVLLKAEALVAAERGGEARDVLEELHGCAVEDPGVFCSAGHVLLAAEDPRAAERAFRAALALDADWADAHHGLGCVHEQAGDRARMIEAWLRTRELDLASEPEPWHLSTDEFERIAEAAMAELPPEVLALLANVPVMIDDVPSEDVIREGYDPRLLGLFSGVPLPEKSHVMGTSTQLDSVLLYQRNLERMAGSDEELAEEIRITVLHETAHFFGLEDEDLDEIGLG
jgi:predicted Zn-dependent protease with MMP-like domain/Flp pilus assembly protein TadD